MALMRTTLRPILLTIGTVLGLVFLCSCAVPFGPGYQIERQQLEARYLATSPAHLHIQATYRLRNIGNDQLGFLEAVLPSEPARGRENLRVSVDGREVSVQSASEGSASVARILFDPPWPPKQRRILALEYDLAPTVQGDAELAVNEGSFHSRASAAFPLLRPPAGGLVEHGKPPRESRLTVLVPADFQVFAGGQGQGSRQRGRESEYRFGVNKKSFEPLVLAGHYYEQRIEAGGDTIIFWTLHALPANQAQAAAVRLGGTYQTYRSAFGQLWKSPPPVHVVETPARLTQRRGGAGDAAGVALLAGALLNGAAFRMGITSDTFLTLAEHELAHTWFGEAIAARPHAEAVLGEALAEYATLVAAEARAGESERKHETALLLRWFDESRKKAADKPLLEIRATDPYEKRVFGYSKGALFFVGLEDRYGKENVRHALAHLVNSLSGSRFGYAELRAALELETREKLADFFRLWLDERGIPDEFRAQYEVKEQHPESKE